MIRLVVLAAAIVLLAACDGAASDSESGPSMDEVVAAIEDLPSVNRTVRLTEDNDPNDLIGRPNGYDHGAVFYDSRIECESPGIECGAFLEMWDDAAGVKSRSQYIQALQEGAPMLGSEFHYVDGRMLLRVTGELTPSAAKEYEAAFNG